MKILWNSLIAIALMGCSQEISTGGGGSDRPSIIAACSQGFKSEPQPVHRPSPTSPTNVVVNVPKADPTIRCDRTDARTGLTE